MSFRGFSSKLQTARDLLSKLDHDFKRVERNPRDPYPVFDFFVTAEHMSEWLPGNDPLGHPNGHGGDDLLLNVCHLANGAKHFEARRMKRTPVAEISDRPGAFDPAAFDSRAFDVGGLVVRHDGFGARAAGNIDVIDLATEVLDFWRRRLS